MVVPWLSAPSGWLHPVQCQGQLPARASDGPLGSHPPLCCPFIADQEADVEAEDHDLAGQGSFKLEGSWLKLRQFHGLIVKRFHCAKRNTKALFSQILLPAFFVCVAMTVALSVPEIGTCKPSSQWVWEDTVEFVPFPFQGPGSCLTPGWVFTLLCIGSSLEGGYASHSAAPTAAGSH